MGDLRSALRVERKVAALAVMSFTILGMTACGKETAGVSSVSVDKDGKVTSVLYEEFDKDYYSLDELKNMLAQNSADE